MVDREAANPEADNAEPGARVTATTHGTHRVELWGVMPIGWLGNFTRGTTRFGLDIVRGEARRGSQRRWAAVFEMRASAELELELEDLDFMALARDAGGDPPAVTLDLLRFELTRSAERAGALELRIRAPDQVGFLAALLAHLAGFVLFPEEVSIDTFHSEAQDSFLLSSVGGQSPPPEIEGALRASLRRFTRERISLFPST